MSRLKVEFDTEDQVLLYKKWIRKVFLTKKSFLTKNLFKQKSILDQESCLTLKFGLKLKPLWIKGLQGFCKCFPVYCRKWYFNKIGMLKRFMGWLFFFYVVFCHYFFYIEFTGGGLLAHRKSKRLYLWNLMLDSTQTRL